jgi:hypothetical protein
MLNSVALNAKREVAEAVEREGGVTTSNQSLGIFGLKDIELAGNWSAVWASLQWTTPAPVIITLCHREDGDRRSPKYHFKFARDIWRPGPDPDKKFNKTSAIVTELRMQIT